jgi:ATP-dependent Zn protease
MLQPFQLLTQAQEFAQSKGKARKEGMTNVRFTDVAGVDTVREELEEIVNVSGCFRSCYPAA